MSTLDHDVEPGSAVKATAPAPRPAVAATPLMLLQQFAGNRALATMAAGAQQPVPPIAVPRPPPASLSLEDPSFNPTTRAHDLLRAIDSEQYTYAMKSSGGALGGMTEDVEAERRKVDFPAVLAALDGLTASQVKRVEEVFFDFEKITTLREDLFGGGQSKRKADLTPEQVARLEALLRGTRPEPIPPEVMAELRTYPPEIAGPLKADLEKRADAEPALHRHQADAVELYQLLTGELDEAHVERLMAMHRRPIEEIQAVDALYEKEHGPGTVELMLNFRLGGPQRRRMTELRKGHFAQADAWAIEDKRRRIEELAKEDEELAAIPGGLGVAYDVLAGKRQKEKQALTADIQSILEVGKKEALAEAANYGRASGEAVAERMRAVLGTQTGEGGGTLDAELQRTLAKEDAAVLAASTDPWNSSGSSNLVRAAAAQLVADEKSGATSAKKVIETLKSFRELAQHDLTAQAFDPRVPVEQKLAVKREGDGAITRLAQRYVDDYKAEYTRLAGGKGRSYDEIVASADKADERYISDLSYGGGRTSDLGELEHAMGKKDVDAVKALLRKQPTRKEVDELVAAYNRLGDGRDLRKDLFGTDYTGRAATPELAQIGSSMLVRGGLVTGRDAAQVAEQLVKPTAAELAGVADAHAAEARWITTGGFTEYDVTMEHRGLTGRAREIGDVPETERLLQRTRNDLAGLAVQFNAEKDAARRERLVAEMRRLRATLTGDADAYEKDNERVLGEIRSALSFAVSIALAVAIPGAGAGIMAFLQTTALNIAANVASNFVIKMGDYSLDDLKADVLGGALGAGGAKFGEALMGKVASAVLRPAAEATTETASKLGVQTALAHEVGAIAGAGEKTVITVEEFEVKAATHEVTAVITKESAKKIVITGAKEAGGFFGGIYAPKVMTGDFGLTVEEVLKALAATAAGKMAHRNKPGATEEQSRPAEEDRAGPRREEETAGPEREEETTGPRQEEVALPVSAGFQPEPVPPAADVFGPRSPKQMLLDNGIPPKSAEGFQQVADVLNVVLKVRPTNTASLPVLEAGGVAKPELVKAKTVNRVDQLIGAPADGLGKVGFFEPKLPSQQILDAMTPDARQAVQERFAQRAEEHAHHKEEYGRLTEEGILRVKDGVLQIADPREAGAFKDIGGDHDLFEITGPDGRPLDNDVRRGVVGLLRSMGINVEHADHVSWAVDSPESHDVDADRGIRERHATTEPLVAFVPKSQPREVMAGDVVTGPERTEGVGDRHLPAAEGTVVDPAAERGGSSMAGRRRSVTAPDPATEAQSTRIAARMLEVLRHRWAGASPNQRAEMLVEAVHEDLAGGTGLTRPSASAVNGETSQFRSNRWSIEIGHAALTAEAPSIEEFAALCDHVRHEMEHALIEFRLVRLEAGNGGTPRELAKRWKVRKNVVEDAIRANSSPDTESLNAATPLGQQTAKFYELLRGKGKDFYRKTVDAATEAADKIFAAKEAAAQNATPETQKALADAEKAAEEISERYHNLPDEIQASRAGEQVQRAVERLGGLVGRLETAHRDLVARRADLAQAISDGAAEDVITGLADAVVTSEKFFAEATEALRQTGVDVEE